MKLLIDLYRIHSMSGREKKMRKFIRNWILDNVPDANTMYDSLGNMYITKGVSDTYPVVVAHLDQVQNDHSRDFQALVVGDIILGYSQKSRSQQGLGADDKNGIWVALKCLLKYDVIKVAFFVSEEIGCVGSGAANMSFFADARYVLQCDRRGAHDLITTAGWTELCSQEFVQAIQPSKFGYKPADGMLTDVLTLKENGLAVSCVNISCGYYEPHTDYEITNVTDLQNCLSFVENIIENCLDVYPHENTYTYYDRYASLQDDSLVDDRVKDEKTYNVDSLITNKEKFFELYWDVMKEILQTYPSAEFDNVRWYLTESFPKTYFWKDWTEELYNEVKEFLGKKVETPQEELVVQ